MLTQFLGLANKLLRPRVIAETSGQSRCREPGGIHVALHLAQSDRAFGRLAVSMKDRVMRIFPTLVDQPVMRATCILYESIPVAIAVAVDPGESARNIGPNGASEREVAGAFVISAR